MASKKSSKRTKSSPKKPSATPAGGGRHPFREMPIRFEVAVAALLMIVAICVLYPGHVFQDKIFFSGDNQAAYSFVSAAKQAMEQEDIYPVWNPFLFAGMPSFGSLSYTPYVYPMNFVVTFLRRVLFFPDYTWLFLHTFMVGFGVYLVLRDRKVHYLASICAGVFMMWMPNLVAYGAHGHGSQACAVGYMPFALLFWDRLWRGKGTVVHACALAIVLGFSMLRAHLQISYYTFALVAMHIAFFGIARVRDGMRGRAPSASLLPRRWLERLAGGEQGYSARAAGVELASGAAIFTVVVVAALLISAVLYGPVQDYAQYSIRGASESGGLDYNYATSWSLHPTETITFLIPYAFGFGKDLYIGHMPFTDYPNYLGLFVFMGAVTALFLARSRYTMFLLFVVIVSTLVSFGKFFPIVYDPLFKFLPFFDKFRVPVMVLILQQLAAVLMFGIGMDAALRADPEKARKVVGRCLIGAGAFLLIAILSQGYWSGGFADAVADRIRAQDPRAQAVLASEVGERLGGNLLIVGFVTVLVCVMFYLYYKRLWPMMAVGIVVLVGGLADYHYVNRNVLHPERFRGYEQLRVIYDRSVVERYDHSDELIEFLKKEQRHYRVFPMDHPQQPMSRLFTSNRYLNFGISSIGGYHPAKLSAYESFLRSALAPSVAQQRYHLIDMLNVRYLISGVRLPESPRFRPVWQGREYQGVPVAVYENLNAQPRAFFVDDYRVAEGEDALALLATGAVDLTRTAVLEKEPSVEPVPGGGNEATVTKVGFNEVRIQVDAAAAGLMVVSEIYYPDWKVEIDGAPAEMLRANHILRAVAVESGQYEVVFRYDDSLIVRGAVISGTTFGVVTLLLIVSLVLTMKGRSRGSTDRHSDV